MANNIVREVSPKSIFEDATAVVGTLTCAQGDLIYLNTTSHVLANASGGAETNGATFLGVARVALTSGKIVSPYQGTAVDAAQASGQACPGPLYGVVAKLTLKTGDALVAGGSVYLDPGTGAQGVTSTGTKAIGIYQGPAISSAVAGQQIEVLVGTRYPADSLSF